MYIVQLQLQNNNLQNILYNLFDLYFLDIHQLDSFCMNFYLLMVGIFQLDIFYMKIVQLMVDIDPLDIFYN